MLMISSTYSTQDKCLRISIPNRFEFALRDQFRQTYEDLDEKPIKFIVDFTQTNYIDSTGLGMLLLLRDFAGGRSDKVYLTSCQGLVLKTLEMVKFNELFIIDKASTEC